MHRFPTLTALFARGVAAAPLTMRADHHREKSYNDEGGETALAAYTWGSDTGIIAISRESALPGKEITSGGVTNTRTT